MVDFTVRYLPEDTFSFIIYSHVCSRTFFLAILVFSFQIAVYALLAYDITDLTNEINPFKLPVNVEMPVRIAEAFAIVVAVTTQDDVQQALNLMRDGYDQDPANHSSLDQTFPEATKAKWILSIFLRAFEGLFGLALTFLLIMQSTTVLDLLLNFLAMEFVSQLDDGVFVLTRAGFFGRTLSEEAKRMSDEDTPYKVTVPCTASFAAATYFIILSGTFFAFWWIIRTKQVSGEFLCQQIFAQFGDEVVPMLGAFTGLYSRHTNSYGNRLSYIDDRVGGALLAYCLEQKRWTLSLVTDNVYDPCTWIAASDETIDFDVLTTATSQWVVKDAAKGILPLSQHFLACQDHMHIDNLCGKYGNRIIGDEDDKYGCKCKRGRYGLRCEYKEPCQKMEISQDYNNGFVKRGGTNSSSYFASTFYLLEGAEAYNHPVYTSLLGTGQEIIHHELLPPPDQDVDVTLGDNQTLSNVTDIDIIVFTGVRWILSYKSWFPGLKDINDVSEMAEYFSKKFHGHFTKYTALYISEPAYVSETLYMDSQTGAEASPSNLKWQYSSALAAFQSTFDQRLQPDLEKSPVLTKFSCIEENGVDGPGLEKKSNGGIGAFIGIALAAAFVLTVAYFVCCPNRKTQQMDVEMEELQFDENEEIDVEQDVTAAAECKVDDW
ncbi:hypothetical protein QTG54_010520 [Skeletonema marinoi]|uniref:EGF-like domain-containing protein n=2 Tax=Skeletonema marinoi TaxID=267567 RepID=A0AAD8Y3K7_9STRA|nr:hypothetical protein QTG54_010520 [Skeletonema marinoi]